MAAPTIREAPSSGDSPGWGALTTSKTRCQMGDLRGLVRHHATLQ